MKIFGATLSPFVRKTVAVAKEKGLDFDLMPVPPRSEDPEFRACSPMGKIPGFSDGDFRLCDSSAIIHYLDTKYPEPRLIPVSAEARGKVVWYDEFGDTVLAPSVAKIFFNRIAGPRFLNMPGDEMLAKEGEAELPRLFGCLESIAPDDGGYLVGDGLSLADLAVVSPLVNLMHCDIDIDTGIYPRLVTFRNNILSRPSFAPVIAAEKAFLAA